MAELLSLVLLLCGCLSGVWTLDCGSGKYNKNDECITCPTECSRCISDAICTTCKPGFYGVRCMQKCSESCNNAICLQENGQCVSCKGGHYFSSNKTCAKCPKHCIYCQSNNVCTSCKMGFTGTVCQEECTHCNPVSGCNIETKICTAGCIDGYTGSTCVERCALNCKSCEPVDSNKCRTCADGRYGSNCEKPCPAKCKDESCSGDMGFCTRGCEIGFWGNQCESKCSENCLEGSCFKSNGTCLKGCHGNFTGYRCLCPSECECELDGACNKCSNESGFLCDEQCSSACTNNICSSGLELKCFYGCRENTRGSLCIPDKNIENSDATPTTVTVLIIAFVAVVIIVTCVVLWRKRVANQRNSANATNVEAERMIERETVEMATSEHAEASKKDACKSKAGLMTSKQKKYTPNRQKKLYELAKSIQNKTDEILRDEWQKLPTEFTNLSTECLCKNPPGKLEQQKIGPYEFNKVTVEGKLIWYYFNASYIVANLLLNKEAFSNLPREEKRRKAAYIASIGPTTEYRQCFYVFWRMVWQENCQTIVMLNTINTKENEQYWPNVHTRQEYSRISVVCKTEKQEENYTFRSFNVKDGSEERIVNQFQYSAWPEKERVTNTENFIEFCKTVQSKTPTGNGPILVHGRAGIGRTGTFIALDMLWKVAEDMLDGVDEPDDKSLVIQTYVENLRKQRTSMVETVEQYKFLHEAFAQVILNMLNERGYQKK